MEAFKLYLDQYNDNKSRTELVSFDSVSNVQKAGQIPAAYYPQITILHGTEHVMSLFLSDIIKLSVIRVRHRYPYKYTLVPYDRVQNSHEEQEF